VEDIRKALWIFLGIDEEIQFPSFPQDLIYGVLSMGIHLPVIQRVFISNEMDSTMRDFTKALALRSKVFFELYQEEEAAAGEALLSNDNNINSF